MDELNTLSGQLLDMSSELGTDIGANASGFGSFLMYIIAIQALVGILFLVVQFFIYKSKFKKYSPDNVPGNLKLALDIVYLSVGGFIVAFIIGFILGLFLAIVPALGGLVGILLPIFTIVVYYFILKFLAGRHTDVDKAKKIADQTLVFTILFGILFWLVLTVLMMSIFMI